MLRLILMLAFIQCAVFPVAADDFLVGSGVPQSPEIRQPLGPHELPEFLPGRWKVSVCIHHEKHAWIRFENVDTNEVRSIGRYNIFVGGWYDEDRKEWNYRRTTRAGVYMDREQKLEQEVQQGKYLMLSTYVENPKIFLKDDGYGHGSVRNNCVTYTRDAWHFYSGEYYQLQALHIPMDLRNAILKRHPELIFPSHRQSSAVKLAVSHEESR